jgi:cyclopropane fatty-acyl-phospholipid synthase-like methyltransferase
MELLEFGCGTGGTAIIHAPHVKHIRAIDISPRMIEIAKSRAEAASAAAQ